MEKKYLTAKEAAETMSISAKMVYKLVKSNKIPYTKIGKKVLLPKEKLDTWLSDNTHNV